jgi:hypothetical protein
MKELLNNLRNAVKRCFLTVAPRRKAAIRALLELIVYGVLLIMGASIFEDFLLRRWWHLLFLAITGTALCCMMVLREYWTLRLIEIQRDAVKYLKTENLKLRSIALSAVALRINIQQGLTPSFYALDRDLAAFEDFVKYISPKEPVTGSKENIKCSESTSDRCDRDSKTRRRTDN